MYWFLLKKALPFTLTFIFGAALSAVVGLFGASEKKAESVLTTRTYEFGSRCRARRHNLVAESKPLAILFKPNAVWPRSFENSARVQVTFGADGKVHNVEPVGGWEAGSCRGTMPGKWEAIENASRQIRFEPETVNGLPVTVTREVEINFAPASR
jgi:hypothetical protein